MTDRHYGLFANNQHPIQLHTYEVYNKFLRNIHDQNERANNEAVSKRIEEVVEERKQLLNTKEGETLSIDDISDIYMQVMSENRGKTNMNLTTRSKNGEINDYLEVRRPFGAAQ